MSGLEITNPETGTILLNTVSKVLTVKEKSIVPQEGSDTHPIKGYVPDNSSPQRMIFSVYLSSVSDLNFTWFAHTGNSLVVVCPGVYGMAIDISSPREDVTNFIKVTTEYVQPKYTKGFLEVYNTDGSLQWSDNTLNSAVAILEVHPIEFKVLDLSKYSYLGLENIYFSCTYPGDYSMVDFDSYEISGVCVQKKDSAYRILPINNYISGVVLIGYLRPNI